MFTKRVFAAMLCCAALLCTTELFARWGRGGNCHSNTPCQACQQNQGCSTCQAQASNNDCPGCSKDSCPVGKQTLLRGAAERKEDRANRQHKLAETRIFPLKHFQAPRQVLVSFTCPPECSGCQELEASFQNGRVKDKLREKWMPHVVCDPDATPKSVLQEWGIKQMPTTFLGVYDDKGEIQVSRRIEGPLTPDELIQFIDPPSDATATAATTVGG